MIKMAFAICLLPFALFASPKSINPNYVQYNLYDLNSHPTRTHQGFKVSGVAFNDFNETITKGGTSVIVDEETYALTKKLAQGVFEATPGDSSEHHGTAFHVGGNLLLTNQHVLSVNRKNTTDCRSFHIKLNQNQKYKTLSCKKVHYCDKYLDFCLIEMQDHRKGYSLAKQAPLPITLRTIPSHNLRTIAIGNTQGFGLHASSGFGLELVQGVFKFYAPVFGGNSGGPVFNDHGEVIAIVRSQSKELYGSTSYNVSIPMDLVFGILQTQLHNSPKVLSQLNITHY